MDLHSDLNLSTQNTFFGRIVFKPGTRHRLILEGSPYSFDGAGTISRTITFGGRTFNIQDNVRSNADLAYVFGGYQFDLLSKPRGHFGLQAGGAYLDATGTISIVGTGLTGTRNQTLGIPLAGAEFRIWPVRLISISGGAKGMALGGYGHFVQAELNAGVGLRWFTVQAGYQILDADIHENSNSSNPAGIAPRIYGPIFSLQLRR